MDKDQFCWQKKVMAEDVELRPHLEKNLAEAVSLPDNTKTRRKLYQKRMMKRI